MGAARHFLSTVINSTLIDYAHWLAPEALSILDLNLSDAARVALQKAYPKSHCQHLSFSDMESGHFYQANTSIDLFLANIARTYPLDLKLFFNDVRRVVHKEGVILFATFDSSTLDLVKTQVHIDASEIFVDEAIPKQILKKIPNIQYVIFKKELFDLNESQKIYAYIFVLAPLKILEPLLRLRNFSDDEDEPEIFNGQGAEESENAINENAEASTESEAESEEVDENEAEHEYAESEHETTHETADTESEHVETSADEAHEFAENELVEHEQVEKDDAEVAESTDSEAQEKDEHADKEIEKKDDELEASHEAEHAETDEEEEPEHEGEEEEDDESEGDSTFEGDAETKEITEEREALDAEHSEISHDENHQQVHDIHLAHTDSHEIVDDIKLAQLNKNMETQRQQLETHLHALNKNLNSSAEIIRELRSGRLSQQEQQTKRAALRQHFSLHQTLLNSYQNLQHSHAGLLNRFIDAQEHTLTGMTSTKLNIQKHQEAAAKHEEEAKKHEELLETLRL